MGNIRRNGLAATVLIGLVLLFFCPLYSTELRILYVNDFHGFASGYKPAKSEVALGGIARLAAAADRLRKEKPSLLLAAGDMIQGDNFANLFQGKSVIDVMNAMRFDVMVLGNHEFDFGPEILALRIKEASFPVLGGNVEGVAGLKPYVLKTVAGVRVAVIGLVTEETGIYTHPRNVEGITFLPATTAKKWVEELRKGSDVVVVLSHMGLAADTALAEQIEGIDVIVGGHTHTKVVSPVHKGKTVIVQAWEHGKVLGVLDLIVEGGNIVRTEGHLEEIREGMPEDGNIRSIVASYQEKTDKLLGETVGETKSDLDAVRVRLEETNLGDLVADVVREAANADVAIVNGGGIRATIRSGAVKLGNVYSAVPFDNYVVAIRLRGKEIREALEYGVSGVEDEEGRFPQVSGLSFAYDPRGPKGKRVREILVSGKPLEDGRPYKVATNDFLAAGGDGFKAFGDAMRRSRDFAVVGGVVKGDAVLYSDPGTWIRDLVADYFRRHGPISGERGRRIAEVDRVVK
jgi:5'-nucleotidase / UDP-sugar diphosphatase